MDEDGMKAMSSCATSKADLLASAKTLTENSAGIDAAKTKARIFRWRKNFSLSLTSGGQPCQLDLACRRRQLRRGHHHRHRDHHRRRRQPWELDGEHNQLFPSGFKWKYLLADHHLDLEDHLDLLLTRVLWRWKDVSYDLGRRFMTLIDLLMTDIQFDHATWLQSIKSLTWK